MKKASNQSILKNVKGFQKFQNAVPKEEIKVKQVEEKIVKQPSEPYNSNINNINETTVDDLIKSLNIASKDLHTENKHKNNIKNKSSIQLPSEVNMNPTIAKMYEKLGGSTTVEGYNGSPCHTFDLMKLHPKLLRAIYGVLNWEYPSPIQSYGIEPVIAKRDLICQAQAGTGKTGTYMIAAIHRIDPEIKRCQTIVLSPTRELSEQTYDVSIASHIGGMIARDARGTNYTHNVKLNKDNKYDVEPYQEQIVIATPGRLLMLLNKGFIDPNNVKLVILDEADNILSQGFLEDIGKIFRKLPEDIQVALYSATLSPEIIELSTRFMIDPVQILVPLQEHVMTDNQSQYTVQVNREDDKLEILSDIFTTSTGQTIIFCNRKHTVNYIYEHVKSLGIPCGSINGEMEQGEREISMERFRNGTYKVLIGTDIIARGIDTIVNLVINYDIPNIPTQYVHRCGRTGRFGKHGYVVNIVLKDETDKLKRINHRYSIKTLDFSQFMKRSYINI